MGEEKMVLKWSVKREVEVERALFVRDTDSLLVSSATIDDLRRACEAAGLVVETAERAEADREDRTNLREAYQKLADERDACLDALSEHVSPDATADTPRMIRPSSLLAGIRSLQGRLRDARSDLRDHDAALEAAEARRSSEVTGLGQQLAEVVAQRDDARGSLDAVRARLADILYAPIQGGRVPDVLRSIDTLAQHAKDAVEQAEKARAILNARPGEDIIYAARHMMEVLARQSEAREALRYGLSTIIDEAFGMQPVMTHEELLSFLESGLRERTRDLAAARARIAELEAPMPEATITEIVDTFLSAERAHYKKNRFDHDAADRAGALAVVELVRRERCLIARAVAGRVDVTLLEQPHGMWDVAVHARISRARSNTVTAAEVPAELARMLTEVGA